MYFSLDAELVSTIALTQEVFLEKGVSLSSKALPRLKVSCSVVRLTLPNSQDEVLEM